MWTAACLTDPSLSDQRVELTKPISLVYVIEDNFDVYYGTLDELTLFTNVVNQYVSIIEQYNLFLPFHMLNYNISLHVDGNSQLLSNYLITP